MFSFNFECGNSMFGSSARCALRIRVSMSATGSVGVILPARLGYARDQTVQGHFAELQARDAELAQMRMAAPGDLATIHDAYGAGVARQLGQRLIIASGLQL